MANICHCYAISYDLAPSPSPLLLSNTLRGPTKLGTANVLVYHGLASTVFWKNVLCFNNYLNKNKSQYAYAFFLERNLFLHCNMTN